MSQTPEQLEKMWNNMLSRHPELIREEFDTLEPESQKNVLAHLQRMVTEDGWQSDQRLSALVALMALEDRPDQEK